MGAVVNSKWLNIRHQGKSSGYGVSTNWRITFQLQYISGVISPHLRMGIRNMFGWILEFLICPFILIDSSLTETWHILSVLTFSYSLLSPSPQPGLHLLCFQQIELLLLLQLQLQLQRALGPLHQLHHRLLVQLPLCRPRDLHTPLIQGIPGKAETLYIPMNWLMFLALVSLLKTSSPLLWMEVSWMSKLHCQLT